MTTLNPLNVSRRNLLVGGGLALAAGSTLTACHKKPHEIHAENPEQALDVLVEGNKEFASYKLVDEHHPVKRLTREELTGGQHPIALIFSCIDSRVPPELVFNRHLGELMVIRSGGHALGPAELGSLEYGVEHLHIPLIMVLGHERCGAVKATFEGGEAPNKIAAVAQYISPAVRVAEGQSGDALTNVVKANTSLTVERLKRTPIIKHHLEEKKVAVVGAYYDLDTGAVEITVPAE